MKATLQKLIDTLQNQANLASSSNEASAFQTQFQNSVEEDSSSPYLVMRSKIECKILYFISLILTEQPFNFSHYAAKKKFIVEDFQAERSMTVYMRHLGESQEKHQSEGKEESKKKSDDSTKKAALRMALTTTTQFLPTASIAPQMVQLKQNRRHAYLDKLTIKDCCHDLQSIFLEFFENIPKQIAQEKTIFTVEDAKIYHTKACLLALKALSYFDFSPFADSVIQFIQNDVIHFLDDEDMKIRKWAVKACCSLYLSAKDNHKLLLNMPQQIQELVERFLKMSLSDEEPKIRFKILSYLSNGFDDLLTKKDNLRNLFQCAKSNFLEARQQAISILGKLAQQMPSLINPFLRGLFVEFFSTLDQSADIKEKDNSAKLLTTLMRAAVKMSEEYTLVIFNSLIAKLQDSKYISMVPSVLSAMGELAEVGGGMMRPKLKIGNQKIVILT